MGIFGQLDPTGIVNAVGGIIGQKQQNNFEWKSMQAQNKFAQQQAKQQFAYDTEAWNRQNQYNSPQQVMERYKAAGLNPNLIYGGGMGNTAGTAPAQKAPAQNMQKMRPVNLGGTLGQYQDAKLQAVNIDNARKQGELLDKAKIIKAAEANAATDYFGGRGKSAWWKGAQEDMKTDWMYGTESGPYSKVGIPKDARAQNYFRLMEGQLDARTAGINQAYKRILEMDASIDYKKKLIEWYDYSQMFKAVSPAVGLVKGFFGKGGKNVAKSAPTVRGISDKLKPKFNVREWAQMKGY